MLFSVEKLLENRGDPICARKGETVKDSLYKMVADDFSQLPVVDESGYLTGIISEQSIVRLSYHSEESVSMLDLSVEQCQEPAVTLSPDADIFTVLDRLQSSYAVVITRDRRPVGIVTDWDTTRFFRNISEGLIVVEDIETTLRQYIEAAFPTDNALTAALFRAFGEDRRDPSQPSQQYEGLSFQQHIQLMTQPHNWEKFAARLEPRKLFMQLMDQVRVIRNQLTHFRGRLDPVQRDALTRAQNWLASRPRLEGVRESKAEPEIAVTEVGETLYPIGEDQVPVEYRPFYRHLAQKARGVGTGYTLTLSFPEIETILGGNLPELATGHRSWWTNDHTVAVHAFTWLAAGWRVEDVDEAQITFTRTNSVLYQVFFNDLLTGLQEIRPSITRARKTYPVNYFPFSGGRTGFEFGWSINQQRQLAVYLYINPGDQKTNDRAFQALYADWADIEAAVDFPLRWEPREEAVAAVVAAVVREDFSFTMPADQLEQLKQRAIRMMITFRDAFYPRIKELKLD